MPSLRIGLPVATPRAGPDSPTFSDPGPPTDRRVSNISEITPKQKPRPPPGSDGRSPLSTRTCDPTRRVGKTLALRPLQVRSDRVVLTGARRASRGERMVTAKLRLVVPQSKRAEVLQALRLLCGPTAARMGCESCRVYRDDTDENALLF